MTTIPDSLTVPSSRVEVRSTNSDKQITTSNNSLDSTYAVSPANREVKISSLAERLSKAESISSSENAKLSHKELGDKVKKNIEIINYLSTSENKTHVAKEVPEPNNPASSASAIAANDYVNNVDRKNPFSGLSREQLSAIANDESGSFTTNEKYAAYRQAYDEEQKWRSEVVAKAMQEYEDTGKLTNFFKSALSHFNELPIQEQSLYSEEYAKDLEEKIDLDFNYFTHMGHGLVGQAHESLTSLNKGPDFEISKLIGFPNDSLGFMPHS